MTYRERREAKAERLREWAEKRDRKAAAALTRAHDLADTIPFGQPILVGHHSEGRARRDKERIHQGFGKGFEHQGKAEEFRERADNIERAAEHAIYSDDDDAIPRLCERIASLEAERGRIKAYNASCRNGSPDVSLLDAKQQAEVASVTRLGLLNVNGAYPGYALTNLSGNINRLKKRLAHLEAWM